eukprot:4332867-Prymnesium_polylepis.1
MLQLVESTHYHLETLGPHKGEVRGGKQSTITREQQAWLVLWQESRQCEQLLSEVLTLHRALQYSIKWNAQFCHTFWAESAREPSSSIEYLVIVAPSMTMFACAS